MSSDAKIAEYCKLGFEESSRLLRGDPVFAAIAEMLSGGKEPPKVTAAQVAKLLRDLADAFEAEEAKNCKQLVSKIDDYLGNGQKTDRVVVLKLIQGSANAIGADASLIVGMSTDGYIAGPTVPTDATARAQLRQRIDDMRKRHPTFVFSPDYVARLEE